jgi:hypothetical protein
MDATTGDVRALVGGRDFSQSRFDRATQARRQPGSAFKPFVYAAALADGYAPSQLVSDSVLRLELAGGEVWEPRNIDGSFEGTVTIRDALVRSRNVPTIRLAADVGLNQVTRLARRSGIRSELPPVPSLAIGTAGVTALEFTAAYTAFARLGTAVPPRFVTRVETSTAATSGSTGHRSARSSTAPWRTSSRTCSRRPSTTAPPPLSGAAATALPPPARRARRTTALTSGTSAIRLRMSAPYGSGSIGRRGSPPMRPVAGWQRRCGARMLREYERGQGDGIVAGAVSCGGGGGGPGDRAAAGGRLQAGARPVAVRAVRAGKRAGQHLPGGRADGRGAGCLRGGVAGQAVAADRPLGDAPFRHGTASADAPGPGLPRRPAPAAGWRRPGDDPRVQELRRVPLGVPVLPGDTLAPTVQPPDTLRPDTHRRDTLLQCRRHAAARPTRYARRCVRIRESWCNRRGGFYRYGATGAAGSTGYGTATAVVSPDGAG